MVFFFIREIHRTKYGGFSIAMFDQLQEGTRSFSVDSVSDVRTY